MQKNKADSKKMQFVIDCGEAFGEIRGNQREQLLAALERAPVHCVSSHCATGKWLALRDIISLGIAQYSARIAELRHEGHHIENFREWDDMEQRYHSWYRLATVPGVKNPRR